MIINSPFSTIRRPLAANLSVLGDDDSERLFVLAVVTLPVEHDAPELVQAVGTVFINLQSLFLKHQCESRSISWRKSMSIVRFKSFKITS